MRLNNSTAKYINEQNYTIRAQLMTNDTVVEYDIKCTKNMQINRLNIDRGYIGLLSSERKHSFRWQFFSTGK